jgi:hypothetical protein
MNQTGKTGWGAWVLCVAFAALGCFAPAATYQQQAPAPRYEAQQAPLQETAPPAQPAAPPDAAPIAPAEDTSPAWTPSEPAETTPSQRGACCKICRKGCACGNTCISCSKTCRVGVGCACDG